MRNFACIFLTACAAIVAAPANADAVRDALIELAKCADITDAADRLKCYDAAAPRAKSALGAPAEKPKEAIVTVENFGLPQSPKAATKEEFGKPPPESQGVESIASPVLEFAKTPYGKAVFILENGQVWRQLDADSTNVLDPPAGVKMKVKIELGVFGSYNLTIEGRNGLIKVTRLR